MNVRTKPAAVWEEYMQGASYNSSIGLYDTVKQNEAFFIGRQWEGVNAPDLDKPVINILKRVVSFFISSIVSDDVAARVSLFGGAPDNGTEQLLQVVSAEFERIIEQGKIKAKNRDMVRNAAVDGDACIYLWFDAAQGEIEAELLDNTDVLFGNPQQCDIQRQPYIIAVQRRPVAAVREEALDNGIPPEQAEAIRPDSDPYGVGRKNESGKVTVLMKFWKEEGEIHFLKTTRAQIIKPPTNLKYRLYPFAWMSWDPVKNCYHGQSCITGLIPNQIFINKLFAMCMEHVKKMAFPKNRL